MKTIKGAFFGIMLFCAAPVLPLSAQVPPTAAEIAAYSGLHAAAAQGDVAAIRRLLADGAASDVRDSRGRTPLMIAVHVRRHQAAKALIDAGADLNALDSDRYDVVTIAAVANDTGMLRMALEAGARADQITSPYDGTALIAAAHLGHVEVVRMLIAAGAPLDHVNNLGWTALIESIVLGDGGPDHIACLRALIEAGADVGIADGAGASPLALARERGYTDMVDILVAAGATR